MDRKIKFGFWNYIESGALRKDAVADWKEMRFDLPMSFTFDERKHDKKDMLDVLDECEKFGMKLIICDRRTHFKTLIAEGAEKFTAGVKQAYTDFGKHSATFGFFVGDEPTPAETDVFIEAVKIVMNETHGLTPFANLVPYWGGGSDFDMLAGANACEHTAIVEKLLKETQVPLIGYDQYTQCLDDNYNTECGINSYFYVLDQYCALAGKHKIPFYATLLACGHWSFKMPSEEDIRWQIYTALAHGARGILWFHLYGYEAGSSYAGNPMILCGNEVLKTPLYDAILRQQAIFNAYYREQFDKMELISVYHTGHIYDPKKRFCADDILLDVNGKFSYPTIISYYKEYDTGKKWMSVVNAHKRHANKITLKYQSGLEESFWLACGEMKLIRIDE